MRDDLRTAAELAAQTGRSYEKCREVPCNPLAEDEPLARELWTRTEAAIALGPDDGCPSGARPAAAWRPRP